MHIKAIKTISGRLKKLKIPLIKYAKTPEEISGKTAHLKGFILAFETLISLYRLAKQV